MRSTLSIFLLLISVFVFSTFAGAQSRSLDGAWQFAVYRDGKWTVSDLPTVKAWREIRVPYSWNVQFDDLRDYNGVAWYRKSVDLAPITKDQTVLLKFGAVDYFAEVFVNGTKAGEHEGGYLPFTVDCGKLVKAGTNEIAVRVIDPNSNKERWGDMNYSEVPHGKQSWYVQTGGIWQSVSLEIKSYDLARATQLHQWISLKYQIEELRRHASIQGYTITEFTDLNWECNGLLDMYRKKKSYGNDLAKLQRQDVIFARTPSYNFTSGEKIELTTHVSRYSNAANSQQTIRCYINGKLSGEANIGEAERGSVVKEQTIVLTAPTVTEPSNIRLQLELRSTDETLIAQNYVELFIYPEPEKKSAAIYLAGALQQLTQGLRAAGYALVSTPERGSIVITDTLDPTTQSLLNSGRRMIVLADNKEAIPEGRSIKITPRNSETGFDGNWVSNFNWMNTQGPPFNTLTFDPIQGFEAEKVTPKFVIEGVMSQDYGDVISGIFFGWINKNAVLMLGAKFGKGRAIITTFRLAEAYGTDEYARDLLDGIIRLVDSEGFEPKLAFK